MCITPSMQLQTVEDNWVGLRHVYDCPLSTWFTWKLVNYHFLKQETKHLGKNIAARGNGAWEWCSEETAINDTSSEERSKAQLISICNLLKDFVGASLSKAQSRKTLLGRIANFQWIFAR